MTLKKINHRFKNAQLSYEATPNYQPLIKLSFYFNKLPHVSYEQFHRHWETVHADLTIAAKDFKVCKLQRYVQFHQTPEMKEKAKSLGLNHIEFDGCSEIWVRNWDDWMAFYTSPEYAKVMQPDCEHFMAMPIHVMVGYENLIYGKGIPDDGTDGVTADNLQTR
ncbi:MAG: hypothetical protein FE78DRAFT_40837 [Acidomyces sp. 'richmondensis']|nr:MAG: hypothetical protein FE78DRAFT_40837 [Acidomyces sp. 'richmondensis']